MIVARPCRSHEPDLLIGREFEPLIIQDLAGVECVRYAPPNNGWTHTALECVDYFSVSPDGWEAYLGTQWIGSSEV